MRTLERLPKLRTLSLIATAAGLLLGAAFCCRSPTPRLPHPRARRSWRRTPQHAVITVQFGRAGPLARARHKRKTAPARAAGPKTPPATAGKLSAPKKTAPPSPSCGVRGRPPCTTGAKTAGPTIVTPPPPPGCKGSACPPPRPPSVTDPKIASPTITTPPPPVCRGSACPPPGGPGVIVTPPPSGGGGFGASYLAALPRIAEGARDNAGPVLYAKQVLVLIDQAQPAALEDILAQQYNLQRLNDQTLTLIAARAQLYAIPDGRTVAALVSVLGADPARSPRPGQLRLPPAGRNRQGAGGGAAIRTIQNLHCARA